METYVHKMIIWS